MICSVDGCGNVARSGPLCNAHRLRLQRRGTLDLANHRYTPGQLCAVDTCARPVLARGYCRPHYDRHKEYGDPLAGPPIRRDLPPRERPQPSPRLTSEQRFWVKVAKTDTCWLWTGQKTKAVNGYGLFRAGGQQVVAHRWAYEHEVGPIPAGMNLDHLCRTRLCVRPDHLEPVTPYENMMRGVSFAAQQKKQTHCKRGHEFTPENTSLANKGRSRRCKTCRRATVVFVEATQ